MRAFLHVYVFADEVRHIEEAKREEEEGGRGGGGVPIVNTP